MDKAPDKLTKFAAKEADKIMAMNRHERRAFRVKHKIPFTIFGTNKPAVADLKK